VKNSPLIATALHLNICCSFLFLSACGGPSHVGDDKTHLSKQHQNGNGQGVVLEDDSPKTPSTELKKTKKVSVSTLESHDPADLESLLFTALNQERHRAGLPSVTWSKKLASVARKYSQEMAQTGIVAHVSKLSGSPSDRLKRANIQLPGVSENLAQAGSAQEAHLGLMESPGHRANILDQMAARVGVGVAVIDGSGDPRVMVTQIFSLKPKSIDAMADGDELIAILNRLRKDQGLAPFTKHPWLTRTAAEINAIYSKKGKVEIPDFGSKFERIQSVVLKTLDPAQSIQNVKQLTESKETNIGISLRICRDKTMDQDMVCVIALLGLAAK
jgi:uncharacterized protein YkwD